MVTLASELQRWNAYDLTRSSPSEIFTSRKSSSSQPAARELEHVTGRMLRKAKTSAPAVAFDSISWLFKRGLSPTTTPTELMLRFDSSSQGSHPCSFLLNSRTVMSVDNGNVSAFPDSCCTQIVLAMAVLLTSYRLVGTCSAPKKPQWRMVKWYSHDPMYLGTNHAGLPFWSAGFFRGGGLRLKR